LRGGIPSPFGLPRASAAFREADTLVTTAVLTDAFFVPDARVDALAILEQLREQARRAGIDPDVIRR
jgi:hypothetical protein